MNLFGNWDVVCEKNRIFVAETKKGMAMTEKEKQQCGELYDARNSQELLDELHRCEETCFEINQLHPSERELRKERLRKLLGKTGADFNIIAPFFCDYGKNIEIGEAFFANTNMVILDEAKVTFGNYVLVGPNCSFYTAEHPLDRELRDKGLETARAITVGNSVWFGGNVTVLPGVTIGDNCVIGAGSVVTKDIPPNSIAMGNPCRPKTSLSQRSMYTYRYPHPAITADCIVFAKCEDGVKLLLIERKNEPCRGCWAFPGGFMDIDETAEDAAKRELLEETGLVLDDIRQVGAFSKVDRDPRERVVTIAFYSIIEGEQVVKGTDDARRARWFSIEDLPPLAFDHEEILRKALAAAHL